MKVGLAQLNTIVGDLTGNATKILAAYKKLVAEGADLVITPELAITGYPPQDLIFINNFVEENLVALKNLEEQVGDIPLIVGFVDRNTTGKGKPFFNAAAVLRKNQPRIVAHKQLLPTYDVFDETRYFESGKQTTSFSLKGETIGITICEDLWTPDYLPNNLYHLDPAQALVSSGATLLLNLSASPFQLRKSARRLAMLQAQAKRLHVPIVYCNAVGGNDQLIFDGYSFVMNAEGTAYAPLARCQEEIRLIDLTTNFLKKDFPLIDLLKINDQDIQELYDSLVLGLHDYVLKCGFKKVLLGLSGGIDSALVATLAAAALGREAVTGVLMPGPHSSKGSIDDALSLSKNLGITTMTLPISKLYEEMEKNLASAFLGFPKDATEENIQARLRGITLMALSNKFGDLLLTTGNKSELAVGYCTLYGDMCGGLAVISDVPKTLVYRLAYWINRECEIIPWHTIQKAPSAELRPDQKDQDTLPPYEVLDAILQLAVEENSSIMEIVARGFDEKIVRWVVTQVHRNEYKRQQAALGLRVTGRAFGMGRRFPIAQRY